MIQQKKISESYKGPLTIETYAYKKKSKESLFGNFVKRCFKLDLNEFIMSYRSKQSSKKILYQISIFKICKVAGECESKGPWPFGISIYTDTRLFELFFQNSMDYNVWIEALSSCECISSRPEIKVMSA
jgi:hypothetical protein